MCDQKTIAYTSVPGDIYEIVGKLMFAYGDEAEPIEILCDQETKSHT